MTAQVDISKAFEDGHLIEQAVRNAYDAMLEEHHRLGLPIVVSENGEIKMVPAIPRSQDT